VLTELRATAARHGVELERHGFSIAQVVHAYGDLCQAITDLAFELGAPVQVREFRTLNWCLDNAIADAVTKFYNQRGLDSLETNAEETQLQLGALAHEMRNLVHTATLAFDVASNNGTLLSGPGVTTLQKSLVGLGGLIDRTLADVRLRSGSPARRELFSVADFIAEAAAAAQLEASIRRRGLSVAPVNSTLAIDADRDLLLAALGNLLQNALKFTRPDSEVFLRTYASVDRISIEVEDRCGGLSADFDKMFLPFQQHRADRSGLGLGLSICRRSVAANGGTLDVRDLPGCGCVFTIQLPRYAMRIPTA
jgi:signal transduction histidine kinase